MMALCVRRIEIENHQLERAILRTETIEITRWIDEIQLVHIYYIRIVSNWLTQNEYMALTLNNEMVSPTACRVPRRWMRESKRLSRYRFRWKWWLWYFGSLTRRARNAIQFDDKSNFAATKILFSLSIAKTNCFAVENDSFRFECVYVCVGCAVLGVTLVQYISAAPHINNHSIVHVSESHFVINYLLILTFDIFAVAECEYTYEVER